MQSMPVQHRKHKIIGMLNGKNDELYQKRSELWTYYGKSLFSVNYSYIYIISKRIWTKPLSINYISIKFLFGTYQLHPCILSYHTEQMRTINFQVLQTAYKQIYQMSQSQKSNFSGVKITQKPGGNSSFSLDWGHKEEPIKKPPKNPENESSSISQAESGSKYLSSNEKIVEQAGSNQKKTVTKIVNPPGGRSTFTFG